MDDLRYELKKEYLEKAGIPAIDSRQGVGTFVAKELVYAYAMWISPWLHHQVIEAFAALRTQLVVAAVPVSRDQGASDLPLIPLPSPTKLDGCITMSSLEIADLTMKTHFHVMRDIRLLLEELGLGESSFGSSFLSEQNKPLPMFVLPRDLTITLVSGYSIPMRHRVVTRWMELEAALLAPPVAAVLKAPGTLREALLLALAQDEKLPISLASRVDIQSMQSRAPLFHPFRPSGG